MVTIGAIYTLYVWIFNSRDFVYDGHYFNKGKKIEFNWENEGYIARSEIYGQAGLRN